MYVGVVLRQFPVLSCPVHYYVYIGRTNPLHVISPGLLILTLPPCLAVTVRTHANGNMPTAAEFGWSVSRACHVMWS